MFIFERERQRQSESRGGAEREGDTESESDSRLWAVSTEAGAGLRLKNREIMIWAKVRRLTSWATRAPHSIINYSHHAIHYILMIYLFYNWKFVLFCPHLGISPTPIPCFRQPPIYSSYLWVWFGWLVCFLISHISEDHMLFAFFCLTCFT